jgi:hypothetical protein
MGFEMRMELHTIPAQNKLQQKYVQSTPHKLKRKVRTNMETPDKDVALATGCWGFQLQRPRLVRNELGTNNIAQSRIIIQGSRTSDLFRSDVTTFLESRSMLCNARPRRLLQQEGDATMRQYLSSGATLK